MPTSKRSNSGPIDSVISHLMAAVSNPARINMVLNEIRGPMARITERQIRNDLQGFADEILSAKNTNSKQKLTMIRKRLENWMDKQGYHS